MSELLVLALKFAFLALLWVFILFTGAVIRSDLFGRRVPTAAVQAAPAASGTAQPARRNRRARRTPTTLRITKGKQAGLTMNLGDQLKIGRSTDCQLILDDDYVSTRHARIYRAGDGYLVEDLGSTNGTYLNGSRVEGQERLKPGDKITIGDTEFRYEE